jgi:hypothetical protein
MSRRRERKEMNANRETDPKGKRETKNEKCERGLRRRKEKEVRNQKRGMDGCSKRAPQRL